MGFITGLKAIEQEIEKANAPKPDTNYTKVNWLKLKDGETIKVRVPNELDEDSPNFDPARGISVVYQEHVSPKDYRRKAACTMDDEGRCWACEMAQEQPRTGWRVKMTWYTNVINVDTGEVYVWSRGLSNKSAFNFFVEQAHDSGSISNVVWKIKRLGSGVSDTSYVCMPGAPDTEPFDYSGYELNDLTRIVRHVPYTEQEDFYTADRANAAETPVENVTTSIDW